jgi:hypothetical protein
MLSQAEFLFRGSETPEMVAGNGLQRAVAVTNLFSLLYTHSIPFDRALLRKAWSGCTQGGATHSACQLARVRANTQLGRFELRRRQQGGS